MASVEDLKRAREEFFASAMGQRTRAAWSAGRNFVPTMTEKQKKYLNSLLGRVEQEVYAGRIAAPDAAYILDLYSDDLTVPQASTLIDRCKRILGED